MRLKFLAAVILAGQLNSDRTSERHSFEVTSIEYMLTQDCMFVDWAGGRSVDKKGCRRPGWAAGRAPKQHFIKEWTETPMPHAGRPALTHGNDGRKKKLKAIYAGK